MVKANMIAKSGFVLLKKIHHFYNFLREKILNFSNFSDLGYLLGVEKFIKNFLAK